MCIIKQSNHVHGYVYRTTFSCSKDKWDEDYKKLLGQFEQKFTGELAPLLEVLNPPNAVPVHFLQM